MSEFTRDGNLYSLDLSIDEAHILINLVEQLLELLGEGDFNHHYDESDPCAQLMSQLKAAPDEITTPEDPGLLRLLPNAYADPEAAAASRFKVPIHQVAGDRGLAFVGLAADVDQRVVRRRAEPLFPLVAGLGHGLSHAHHARAPE